MAGAAGFENLRSQFEQRRHAHFTELARAMGEVDVGMFTETQGSGRGDLEFELCGALPPTTSARRTDLASTVAIAKAEKQAAQDLIARSRQVRPVGTPGKKKAPVTVSITDSSSQPAPPESERPPTPKSPGAALSREWEGKISDFYRQAEFKRNDALEEVNKAKLEAERQTMEANVQEFIFERKHRQRELAIIAVSTRAAKRAELDNYRCKVELQLEETRRKRQDELAQMRQKNQDQRDKAKAKKAGLQAYSSFMLKHGMLDKTVRQVDTQKIVAKDTAQRIQRAREQQEAFALRSSQLASRKLLCDAERTKRDTDEKERVRYLLHTQRTEDKRQTDERRMRIRAQQAFNRFLRQAREEVVAREDMGAALSSEEYQAYERTLNAFRDLAQGVRAHNAKMQTEGTFENSDLEELFQAIEETEQQHLQQGRRRSAQEEHDHNIIQPLQELLPRIRDIFAKAGWGRGDADDPLEDLVHASGLEESFRGLSEEPTTEPAAPVVPLPVLPATGPPPPLQAAVAPMPAVRHVGAAQLTARPLRPEAGQAQEPQVNSARANPSQGLNQLMNARPKAPH